MAERPSPYSTAPRQKTQCKSEATEVDPVDFISWWGLIISVAQGAKLRKLRANI